MGGDEPAQRLSPSPSPFDTETPRLSGPLSVRLALRFLRGSARSARRGGGSRLLGSTATAALAASTLGVTAMGVAMALMTGYREDLEAKLIGGNAAVLVYPPADPARATEARALASSIAAMPGVARVEPVAYAQGVLTSAAGEAEVTLRGDDSGKGLVSASAAQLAFDGSGVAGVVLGADLARTLTVAPGDRLRLVVVTIGTAGERQPRFVYRTVRYSGSYESGFAEFDQAWGVASRRLVEEVAPGAIESLEIALADPARASEVAEAIRAIAPDGSVVTDWKELNRELFGALRLQQLALFLLLGLIVLVSTFNVASTLVVLVRERLRDLGMLAALGLSPKRLRDVFLLYGGALGFAGVAAGLALAFAISWLADRFELIHFGPDVASIYFLRAVPFRLSLEAAAAIAGFTLLVTFFSCWFPARRALKIDPAAALRWE